MTWSVGFLIGLTWIVESAVNRENRLVWLRGWACCEMIARVRVWVHEIASHRTRFQQDALHEIDTRVA